MKHPLEYVLLNYSRYAAPKVFQKSHTILTRIVPRHQTRKTSIKR